MTQPTFVPIAEADQVRPARHLDVPGIWTADRPAELVGPIMRRGASIGTPGDNDMNGVPARSGQFIQDFARRVFTTSQGKKYFVVRIVKSGERRQIQLQAGFESLYRAK